MIPYFRRREWDSKPYRIIVDSYNKDFQYLIIRKVVKGYAILYTILFNPLKLRAVIYRFS